MNRMGEDEAEILLEKITNEGLLRTFAALTHRLHAVDRLSGPQSKALGQSVRSQRDRVQAEILKRMEA